MTTAARPTFFPAVGGEEQGYYVMKQGTRQLSTRDIPGHTRLKLRRQGQGTKSEVSAIDMKNSLLEREAAAKDKDILKAGGVASSSAEAEPTSAAFMLENAERDADDVVPEQDSDDDSSDDDDDETAELMKELERIKKEREEEAERKAIEEAARAEQERKEAMLRGNPLLGGAAAVAAGGAMGVKRRWDDDVVFRNQARNEPEVKKRFINDTIRNDFHKKFLNKYVK